MVSATKAIRFDRQVAVITGAGGGLGRTYALLLASKGAAIVVNDVGASLKGDQLTQTKNADLVVNEIRKLGGQAVANYDSVEQGERIIQCAINSFGRIDILINNAGILRDVSFANMTAEDWDKVYQVHLKGAFSCTKAAWKYMMGQKYGRIINTASAAGLYGNFGQVNYSTVKMALVGFTKSLAAEGERKNILVNCIAPLAGTRMTATVMPSEVVDALKPEYVAPLVAYLASSNCQGNGQVFEVGAGWIAKLRWQRSTGHVFPVPFDPENVSNQWDRITDFTSVTYPTSLQDSMMMVTKNLEKPNVERQPGSLGFSDERKGQSQNVTKGDSGPVPKLSERAASLKSAPIFTFMSKFLNTPEGKNLSTKVGCIYQFDIVKQKGDTPIPFTVDLKSPSPKIVEGPYANNSAHFTMSDEDFIKVVTGKSNPQVAFMQGKMKIRGSMSNAMKFTPSLFPKLSSL